MSNKIVFLCSGGGGNLSFVQHAIERSILKGATIVGVLTDRMCPANEYSERIGLYNHALEIKYNDQKQKNLLLELKALNPDIIVTTVHKIIGREIIDLYENKLINLHYSLLPAFSGLIGTKPVTAALEHQVLFGGVSVHLVNEQVDAGRPLVQGAIALNGQETLESFMPVVFRCGCIALLRALVGNLDNPTFLGSPSVLDLLSHFCIFNGGGQVSEEFVGDEAFWLQVQESLKLKKPDNE